MSTINLSELEGKMAQAFIKRHIKCMQGKQGPNVRYIITPTGIGNSVAIQCCGCGMEKNITDVSCW